MYTAYMNSECCHSTHVGAATDTETTAINTEPRTKALPRLTVTAYPAHTIIR